MIVKFEPTLEDNKGKCNMWVVDSYDVWIFLNYKCLLEKLSIDKDLLNEIIITNDVIVDSYIGTLTFKSNNKALSFLKDIEPFFNMYLLRGGN